MNITPELRIEVMKEADRSMNVRSVSAKSILLHTYANKLMDILEER